MKNVLIVLCITLFASPVFASHFAGGELRYEFNGTNYTCSLTLYRICATSMPSLPGTVSVNFKSASTSQNMNQTLTQTGNSIVDLYCAPLVSACYSTSSQLPGYVSTVYTANVTLPNTANDWIMSFTAGTRTNSMNLSMSSATNMYLEARLNNLAAINSSPWIANKNAYYMTVNQPLYVPLQALDAEGDSIVYEIVPAMGAAGTNSSYPTGFSGTAPFGTAGICTINANQVLTLKATQLGQYVIVIKVKDYRNGVLVGTYMREILCAVVNGSSSFTFPMPTTGSVFTVYTCPGQSNSVTVNFTDSTVTDSVYLTVTPPVMTGWTFTPTISNGVASASANISWTTPGGLNPATLPHFYIHIGARDNGCPRAVADYSILVRTRQCAADSVWPGDANGDKTVNIYDPLAIAIANGKTGATRAGATTSWVAQACANWGTTYVTNNVDIKHGDCNGDGTINSTDLASVTANWGLVHAKNSGGGQKTTGDPELYFDLTGVKLEPGKMVSIPIMIGTQNVNINDIYGLATVININGMMPAARPVINTTSSWLGSSNMMNYDYSTMNNTLHWAYSRMDQTNASGFGKIGTLDVKIPDGLKTGNQVTFEFNTTKIIDKDGRDIAFNTTGATGIIDATGIDNIENAVSYLAIVPNPSQAQAELRFALVEAGNVNIRVVDVVGKTVWQHTGKYSNSNQALSLPKELSAGMYMVILNSENGRGAPAKWIKQ